MVAEGLIDGTRTMRIYDDGAFVIRTVLLRRDTAPDWLTGFSYDMDSMRRKSATGRGVAAMMTGGASLLAANNRGVVYVTVMALTASLGAAAAALIVACFTLFFNEIHSLQLGFIVAAIAVLLIIRNGFPILKEKGD